MRCSRILHDDFIQARTYCDVDAMFKFYSALGGDLHRHCIAYDSDEPASSRSEREVVFLLRQILEGIKHMHDQDFVHLDIKVRTACGVDIVFELFLLSNVCLGLDFREGVVTLRDLSKHSTVNFFVANKLNQFTEGRSLFTQ